MPEPEVENEWLCDPSPPVAAVVSGVNGPVYIPSEPKVTALEPPVLTAIKLLYPDP